MVGCPSSLTIVPAPWLSLIVALTGFERLTKNVSLGSNLVSPLTVTATGWLVTPGRKVTVPRSEERRVGKEGGVRWAAAQWNEMVWKLALDSLTVKVNTVCLTLPSFCVIVMCVVVGCLFLLSIVPAPWLSLIVALTGFERLTKNVSLGSNLVSPLTVTATGWLVTPGRKVTVPLAAT